MAAWKRSSPAFFCPMLARRSGTRPPPLLKRGQSLDPLPNQYERIIIDDNESARTRSAPGQTAEGFAVCTTTRSRDGETLVMDDCRLSETAGRLDQPGAQPDQPGAGARPARGSAGTGDLCCVSATWAVAPACPDWSQRPGACWEQSHTPTGPLGSNALLTGDHRDLSDVPPQASGDQ